MNTDAAKENRLTLQNILGLNEAVSEKILGSSVLLSISGQHPRLVEFLQVILEKTFENVHTSAQASIIYSCEVITDPNHKLTEGPHVLLGSVDEDLIAVSLTQASQRLSENNHPFIYFIASCYAGAMVLKAIYSELPVTISDEVILDLKKLIKNPEIFTRTVDIGSAYLAGAGAVGNSFLYALSTFFVEGKLKVADPDFVSGGNLNRCLFFSTDDIDKMKVDVLVSKAQPFFDKLKLIAEPHELSKVADNNGAAWLDKLIIGVDSRRARRNLQSEIPREVFDASTTGITEIVVHHHKRPLEGACLGCIYVKERQEDAHENHIAEALGVSLVHVQRQFIESKAASLIGKKYSLDPTAILGLPYDTLFKQLCGEGKLMTAESKQVLAPLAFVSALAGAFLALMLIEKHLERGDYNYWRVSPWANPNYRLQQLIPSNENCEFCNSKTYMEVAEQLWTKKPK